MLFSVNYQSAYRIAADEIKCPFNKLGYIVSLVKDYPYKRYVAIVDHQLKDEKEVELLKDQIGLLKSMTNSYTIEFASIQNMKHFLSHGYNAFLKYPITDWEAFSILKEIGVSDIYIDGPLCFQAKRIEEAKGKMKIRVSPTISPNASIAASDRDICSAFLRPEDWIYYADSIDVIDFREPDQNREDALYKIYKKGSCNFDLKDLIRDLRKEDNVENWAINKDFGKFRANCYQSCKIPGHSCHYCEKEIRIIQAAKKLSYQQEKDS